MITKGKVSIGVEVKSSKKWDKSFNSGLQNLVDAGKIKAADGVYLGFDQLKSGPVSVLPFAKFISMMYFGKLI